MRFLIVTTGALLLFIFSWGLTQAHIITYKAESVPEAFWAEVTAYSEIDSCHYPNCEMASGERAYIGAIACPRNMELGVMVEIDGLEYECGDRYNKNLSYRFDIFMGYGKENHEVAKVFGKQMLAVKIIE